MNTTVLAELFVAQELIMFFGKPEIFLSRSKETNGRIEHELSLFDILWSIFELSRLNLRWECHL